MKRLVVALLIVTGITGVVALARAQQTAPTQEQTPTLNIKNRADAPIRIIAATVNDGIVEGTFVQLGIFEATLQFDNSGVWNAYCLRWNLDYGPGHKSSFGRCLDKAVGPSGERSDATFLANQVSSSRGASSLKDQNGTLLKLQSAEVELLFAVKSDGSTWGDITADTVKESNGTETSPYLRLMGRRKQ